MLSNLTNSGENLTSKAKWFAWVIGLLWLLAAVILVDRTGCVIVDGFQSLGAVAASTQPADLHWPMLDGFMGYDQTWGFHWIGWPMLRSFLLPVLAWRAWVEMTILCAIWLMASASIMRLAKRSGDYVLVGWVGIITLMAPGFLVALQSYRPEIPTALFLVIALRHWSAETARAKVTRFLCLTLLPLLHPLGFVVPGSWLALAFFTEGNRHGWGKSIVRVFPRLFPIMLGVAIMGAWMWWQPDAWAQFRNNILSQRLLIQGLGPGHLKVMRWAYGSLGSLPLVLLLVGALTGSVCVWIATWRNKSLCEADLAQRYAAIGLVAAVLFNIVAKNPNPNHLIAVAPLAAWMYVVAIKNLIGSWPALVRTLAYAAIVCASGALMGKNLLLLLKHRGFHYRGALEHALAELPESRKVLIPVVFWEAALNQPQRGSRKFEFSTFPNIIERNDRAAYEQQVLDRLMPGDLLIWDNWQEEAGVFNFVEATALRHVLIRPEKADSAWQKISDIHLGPAYSRNQPVNFQVYRKR